MMTSETKAAKISYIQGGLGYELSRFNDELTAYTKLLRSGTYVYAGCGKKASIKRRILELRGGDLLRISRLLDGIE